MTIKNFLLNTLLAALSVTAQAAPQLIDEVAAVVEDDIIMQSELDQRVDMIRKQSKGQGLPPADVLRNQVLEQMITESIQLQMADRAGVRITDDQLNEALNRIAAQNKMTLAQFRNAMEAEGVPFSQAREQIETEMRISRVQRYQVGERIQITDQDVDYFLASDLGKMASAAEYHLGHILISVPSEASADDLKKARAKAGRLVKSLRNGADFRKTAIAESSGRNALNGGDLGWRKEAQLPGIFAEAVPKLNAGQVSDPIKSASGYHIVKVLEKRGGTSKMITQTKTRHILIQTNELRDQQDARELIQTIYQRLKAGEDFAALAREYSDDPGSGASGGDLGWVNPGDMVPAFDATMQDTAAGHISAPFESQFGWHILKVEDRRETDVGAENQRNQVRNMLYNRRFEEELPIWLRKIRSEAYVDIKADS
ncbi:MAG: molecular chaperone SurA [Oceanospirillaceae bacterium]|nr:molecular chaperone SurA [Oceanospirillaceae bacterium]MBT13132.1 molecular chaperone SurA [Oceanospirillaceae bacterium]|tara:strand:- start:8674 stop:9954 length:1281 start_codon:yes stop_codon:yes gene_type:complete